MGGRVLTLQIPYLDITYCNSTMMVHYKHWHIKLVVRSKTIPFVNKKNAFWFLFFFYKVFFWRNSPSFSEAGGLLLSALRLITPSWSPSPGSGCVGRPLSTLSTPQCKAFEVLHPMRPPAHPFQAQPIPILAALISAFQPLGVWGYLQTQTTGRSSCSCPRCLPWHLQVTWARDAGTLLTLSASFPLLHPRLLHPPTSPADPLHLLTPTWPLGWGRMGVRPSSGCSAISIYL